MKRILSTSFALTAALCTIGLAAAQSTMESDKMSKMGMNKTAHTFKIDAQNGSGESGTATLTQNGDTLLVKLSLTGSEGMQPAHIHKGTCANLDPKPAYPLTTVSDGTSTTSIKGLKYSTLIQGTYAINVHKSTTDLKDYVACGDLKVASAK